MKNAILLLTGLLVLIGLRLIVPIVTRLRGKRELPEILEYLAKSLPPAIIALLAVSCIVDLDFSNFTFGFSQAIGVVLAGVFCCWTQTRKGTIKKNPEKPRRFDIIDIIRKLNLQDNVAILIGVGAFIISYQCLQHIPNILGF